MLQNYETVVWCFVGAYLLTKPHFSPWAGYVSGAMILVLSLVKLFG